MKKFAVLGTTLCMGMLLASCGSSKESAYRKAYEKARAQDAAEQPVQEQAPADVPVVTPVEQQPTVQTPTTGNYDNEPVRREDLSVVSGDGLNNYSVVVGPRQRRGSAAAPEERGLQRPAGLQRRSQHVSRRGLLVWRQGLGRAEPQPAALTVSGRLVAR